LNSTSNDQKSAIDTSNQNEWLWGYLRDRKKFSDLSEAQRRSVIEIEIQTLRESGDRVPEIIPDERWIELLKLPSTESRK
ncbi:unnamed protein product, partial [Rotaria magnacalcarata]